MTLPPLLAWRAFQWDGDYLLSPARGTKWYNCAHEATEYAEGSQLRNAPGIHASYLPPGGPDAWLTAHPREDWPLGNVIGLIAMTGKVTEGTEGVRGQRATILAVLAMPDVAAQIAQRYPAIAVYWVTPDGGAERLA